MWPAVPILLSLRRRSRAGRDARSARLFGSLPIQALPIHCPAASRKGMSLGQVSRKSGCLTIRDLFDIFMRALILGVPRPTRPIILAQRVAGAGALRKPPENHDQFGHVHASLMVAGLMRLC